MVHFGGGCENVRDAPVREKGFRICGHQRKAFINSINICSYEKSILMIISTHQMSSNIFTDDEGAITTSKITFNAGEAVGYRYTIAIYSENSFELFQYP